MSTHQRQSGHAAVEPYEPAEPVIVTHFDGIKPLSRFRIEFDIWDEDEMRAVRQLTDKAVTDSEATLRSRVGLIRGAEDIDPAWVRMIARHGARHVLGIQRNPEEPR